MAERVRRKELSPVELVNAHLAQIDKHNGGVNAFVVIRREDAKAAAIEAEQRVMSGERLGPLHGVPVTVKDSLDMRGLPTTCGSRFFQDRRAHCNATVVQRLKAAGAIIIGKTNTPEFLASYETDNYITGRTTNPWDPARTPGGSSGGEAAAISAFMSAGGIGSDGGGSIRVPAHFCGITGLKPTPGRISGAGHVPAITHPGGLLGVVGPIARTAGDLRVMFEVLAGYDLADPFSAPIPLSVPHVDGVRIGMMEQFLHVPVQREVRETVCRAGQLLSGLGFEVEPFQPQGIEHAPNVWWFLFGELPARVTLELIAGREEEAHWTATETLKRALEKPEPTSLRVLEMLAERDNLRGHLLRQMEKFPVLLLPVCGIPAFRHRERRWPTDTKEIGVFQAMMPATTFNLFGLPGISIPFGMSAEGMPIGVQLVGRPYQEEALLEIAERMEQARGPVAAPPGF